MATSRASLGSTAGPASRRWAIAAVCVAAVGALAALPAADDLAARRKEVAAMSPADQQELLRKQERFAALPAAEQDRLRALQAAIDADLKRDRLMQVATNYHQWLKSLSPGERAKLIEKAPAERIASIEQTVRRQKARREFQRSAELLTRSDMSRIIDWIEDILWEQKDKLIADMSSRRRRAFEMENDSQKRRELLRVAIERSRDSDRKNRVEIKGDDIERLQEKLSEKVRAELSKQPDLESKRQLVGRWIVLSMWDRSDFGRSRRGPPLPRSDMAQFFEEQLPIPKQDELMNMSPEEAREELRRMYFLRERGEWMFRDGPRGPRDRSRGEGPRERDRRDGPPPGFRGEGPPDGPPRPGPPPDGEGGPRGSHRDPSDRDSERPPPKSRPAGAPDEEPPAPVL